MFLFLLSLCLFLLNLYFFCNLFLWVFRNFRLLFNFCLLNRLCLSCFFLRLLNSFFFLSFFWFICLLFKFFFRLFNSFRKLPGLFYFLLLKFFSLLFLFSWFWSFSSRSSDRRHRFFFLCRFGSFLCIFWFWSLSSCDGFPKRFLRLLLFFLSFTLISWFRLFLFIYFFLALLIYDQFFSRHNFLLSLRFFFLFIYLGLLFLWLLFNFCFLFIIFQRLLFLLLLCSLSSLDFFFLNWLCLSFFDFSGCVSRTFSPFRYLYHLLRSSSRSFGRSCSSRSFVAFNWFLYFFFAIYFHRVLHRLHLLPNVLNVFALFRWIYFDILFHQLLFKWSFFQRSCLSNRLSYLRTWLSFTDFALFRRNLFFWRRFNLSRRLSWRFDRTWFGWSFSWTRFGRRFCWSFLWCNLF